MRLKKQRTTYYRVLLDKTQLDKVKPKIKDQEFKVCLVLYDDLIE